MRSSSSLGAIPPSDRNSSRSPGRPFTAVSVERDPDVDALVVLPPADRLESETDELSDEDLEIVVGGFNAPKHGGMQFEWSDFV